MRKAIIAAASTVVGLTMLTTPAAAKCGELSITEMNWASSQVVTAVAKFILEQGYGCSVKKVPSATVTAATSLAENAKPDIATEMWYNSSDVYGKLEKEGKVVTLTNVLSDGGVEGWWIPKYLAEKHPELKTIDGILKNPKLVGGKFHNCPDGWGCRIANDNQIIAYKVKEAGLEIFNHGSGETLATSIASAYADKKPWFGYYWAPTDILGKFPMVKVDMGPISKEIHLCNAKKDCATPGKSSYPPSRVVTGVTKAALEREPDAMELLKKLSFTNEQMGKILAWKKDKNASADEAAVYFLTNYKDTWSSWLNDDAKKKLAAILK